MARTGHPCSTAAKREALAGKIEAIVAKHAGVTVERCTILVDNEINLDVAFGPYHVMINLDGGCFPGAHMAHWHTRGEATYPKDFDLTIRGTINTSHYGKATTIEHSEAGFLRSLDDGLGRLMLYAVSEAA